jgi:hypothetical protein
MKFFVLLAAICSSLLHSQVMNDAQILLGGKTGINLSAVRSNGKNYPAVGIGVGFIRGLDLEIGAQVTPTSTFVVVNTEFALKYKPNLSFSFGGHFDAKTSGADITLNSSFPVSRFFTLYTGVDADVNISGGQTTVPVWYFVGLTTFLNKYLEVFVEADPAVSSDAITLFAGGLRVYF